MILNFIVLRNFKILGIFQDLQKEMIKTDILNTFLIHGVLLN